MSTGNPKSFVEDQLKELRVALPKMKLSESQSQPSTSSSQIHDEINAIAGELAEKKLLESDDSKSPKKGKDPAPGDGVKAKGRRSKAKSTPTESKEKEQQKPGKSDGEGSPKKRSISKEKKGKAESEKSTGQAKEKVNTPKGKEKLQEKKVSGTPQEKKTPAKADESHEFKDIKDLLREDPALPPGWRRIIKGKHVGTELKPVVCIASPEGRKFYFKARLNEYLEKTNSQYSIDDFYFGLYERPDRDKGENKSGTPDGRKSGPKKSQKLKRPEAAIQEHETKKIRLDSGAGATPKKGQAPKSGAAEKQDISESADAGNFEAGGKNLLLEDPELPDGWVRKVLIKNDAEGHTKVQVRIISPDGRKFATKGELLKYLQKTKSSLDIGQFYFGMYARKKPAGATATSGAPDEETKEPGKKSRNRRARRRGNKAGEGSKKEEEEDEKSVETPESPMKSPLVLPSTSKADPSTGEEPMWEDPNLPPGWRRSIKVRSAGESAGRMEVIISSPDGKRHRSKASLEHYLKRKGLNLSVDDFDFTIYGKNSKKQSTSPSAPGTPKQKSDRASGKKRISATEAAASAPEETQTRESSMINYVSALMLNCGLRDLRSERRLRTPKESQEKILKEFLDNVSSEDEESDEISPNWVKKLAHCRSDFGTLEDGAAEAIAKLTKDFLSRLAQSSVKTNGEESTLDYDGIADVVDKCENLAPLRTIIPKKISYKDYMKMNRPKKFSSFT